MAGLDIRLLTAAVCCERGKPPNNEDNYFMNGRLKLLGGENLPALEQCVPVSLGVYAVCDGMGGASFGEVAAAMAVEHLAHSADDLRLSRGPERAADVLAQISAGIRQEARRRRAQMGAAIVLAVTSGSRIDLYNVGDCRAYLWQPGGLRQLSEDDTMEQMMKRIGGNIPSASHQLTQFLGMDEDEFSMEPHHCQVDLPPDGRLLLCSDGLTDMIGDDGIASCMAGLAPPKEQAQNLVRLALEAGGRDNVTAMVIADL